ncbi:MAG TPA: hypothetical protein PLV25_07135 [Opitutales bacterium]|nr:hypothetical protein [Opitutales bacterium]
MICQTLSIPTALGDIHLETYTGDAVASYFGELAKLCKDIFCEYPYLYAATSDYEAFYQNRFLGVRSAVLILARNQENNQIIGASTGQGAAYEMEEVRDALVHGGLPLERTFYCCESLLYSGFRGRGIGRKFFEMRMSIARALMPGLEYITFCAIDRPENHPAKPENYVSPEYLWKSLGFERRADMRAEFSYPELGSPEEILHPMTFWVKKL